MTLLGAIVAHTTLLTSLLFYFGWSHAVWFFDYFGVNSTLLGLTTQDYLIRSLDALFVPMTVAACAGLLVLWGHAVLRARLAAGYRPRRLRVLVPVMAVAGLVLAVTGLSSVFATTAIGEYLAVAPLSLGSGVLLLVYAFHLRRSLTAANEKVDNTGPQWVTVVEAAGVFVLVGLSLFWPRATIPPRSAAHGRASSRRSSRPTPMPCSTASGA